jgi:excisionase family DNA binding protein
MKDVSSLNRGLSGREAADAPGDTRGLANGRSPLLLTAEQVAELLAISKRQVWRLESSGRIPKAVRLGERQVRWRSTDLIQFVNELGTHSTANLRRA